MLVPRHLLPGDRIVRWEDEEKARRWIKRKGFILGWLWGFGECAFLAVLALLVLAHRHGWLY